MIVLTGGAGFIGSVVLSELNRRGEKDIIVVDHLGDGSVGTGEKWKNLRGKYFTRYCERSQFLEELRLFPERFCNASAIIHIGACSSTTERDVDYLMRNNVLYSQALAEFAKQNSIRFIYASSAATYGMGENGYSDTTDPHILMPLNAYGFSKNVFDSWLQDTIGFDWGAVGLKFFNVYGPNEYHKGSMASLVVKAYEQITTEGSVKLFKSNVSEYPDGGQVRDFIYVKDCAAVVADLVQERKTVTGLLNCGSGNPRSWNDLARAAFRALNASENIKYIDMPAELSKQYQNYTCADMSKSQSFKLLENPTTLEEGVKDYITNYLSKGRAYL